MAKCKVCGAPHAVCGPRTTVIPVDQRVTARKEQQMPLKRYTVVRQDRRGETEYVVKLTDDEAKRIGAKPVDEKAKAAPANKARSAANKGGAAPKRRAPKKVAAPAAEKPAAPAADKQD